MLLTRKLTYTGANFYSEEFSLPEIWFKIHESAFKWLNLPKSNVQERDRAAINEMDVKFIITIKDVKAQHWSSLCAAAGWTAYGAVALSWCKDAVLADVWAGWLASGFPLKPLPEFERPARFINPALLPKTTKTGAINAWARENYYTTAETYQLAVSACIAALKDPLEFDLDLSGYENAMPQIAAFLKSRLLQKPNRTAEENAVMDTWSQTIKDTEWDVWDPNKHA